MKRFFSILLSTILFFANSFTAFSASSESATAQLQEMYAQGELLMTQGDYAGAAAQFENLGAYSDASQMAMYCKGIMAAESLGMYDVAISAFQGLGDFKDSKQLATYYQGRSYQAAADVLVESEVRYDLVNARDMYDEAAKVYSGLALFKDCLTRLSACQSGSDKAQEKINTYDYATADKLEKDGKLEEALEAFKALGSYSDSAERAKGVQEKIYARDYAAADQLEQDGKYEEAIKAFKALGSYSDSAERAKGAQEKIYARDYAAADKLEQMGKYKEAIDGFNMLGNYGDSIARSARILEEHRYEIIGNIVMIGTYEQDNNIANGMEPIEWIVLDVQDKKSLLLSRYGLEQYSHYPSLEKGITWEKSAIRTWLNQTFINQAFNEEEKKIILLSDVNNKNQGTEKSRDGGKNTKDKVFLLSYKETCLYFMNDADRICKPTAHAKSQNGVFVENGNCGWWLRSPAHFDDDYQCILPDGSCKGNVVSAKYYVVRPAMWIDLTSKYSGSVD